MSKLSELGKKYSAAEQQAELAFKGIIEAVKSWPECKALVAVYDAMGNNVAPSVDPLRPENRDWRMEDEYRMRKEQLDNQKYEATLALRNKLKPELGPITDKVMETIEYHLERGSKVFR